MTLDANRTPFANFVFPFVYLLTLPLSCIAYQSPLSLADGLTCADHPAYRPSLTPVLIRSWAFHRSASNAEEEVYIARYLGHTYAPVSDRSSQKYVGLDFFYTAGKLRNPNFRMYFQRPAKVYLFVDVEKKAFNAQKGNAAFLPGWQDQGWAVRVSGAFKITYGIHIKATRIITKYAYVFSKQTEHNYIDLPQTRYIKERIQGIQVKGPFNLWIAEEDGHPSKAAGAFRGKEIKPNMECPTELHDAWVTRDSNAADEHTAGVEFRTWHPQWDPCFWCAYDHDHGSSPKHLFGYEPKYGYVAFKNGNENESHEGFKGFVYRTSEHFVFYSLHVQSSSLRRVTTRFHTIHLVIASRGTREILVDLSHKGDFGFQSVRLLPGNRFRPITARDREIQEGQKETRKFRSITVLDFDNLVEDIDYRRPLEVGQYEEWQTLPICTHTSKFTKTIRVIFKQPATGIKSETEISTRVDLGKFLSKGSKYGQLVKSSNLVRAMLMLSVEVSDKFCPQGNNGFFYTDPFGQDVVHGPSENAVRQYIKPGFDLILNGRFEPVDQWVGLHANHARGFFQDHGYGINPLKN